MDPMGPCNTWKVERWSWKSLVFPWFSAKHITILVVTGILGGGIYVSRGWMRLNMRNGSKTPVGHPKNLVTGQLSRVLYTGYIYPYTLNLGVAPSQDASHHQDYEPFLVGNPYCINLHLPLASWEGGQPNIYPISKIGHNTLTKPFPKFVGHGSSNAIKIQGPFWQTNMAMEKLPKKSERKRTHTHTHTHTHTRSAPRT